MLKNNYLPQDNYVTETEKSGTTTKVIAISEASRNQSLIGQIDEVIANKRLTPLQRIDAFFQTLFQARNFLSINTSDFKQWQIRFSKLVAEGQQCFDFVNTVSAMDLSEIILASYHGMMLRFQESKSESFFEVWLTSNKRILQA